MNRSIATTMLLILLATTAGEASAAATKAKKAASSSSSGSRSSEQAPVKLYRYKNDQGALVTGSTIAPEYARKGYQIVTMGGVVLETIPPEPTPEERAAYEKNQQDKLSAAQQQEKDKELLLRYSTVGEIHIARDRKLAEIDDKIRMLNANISTLKQQIAQERQQAAMFERNGQQVPPATLSKVAGLEKELKVSEDQLVTRQQELASETDRYQKEIARFTELDKLHPRRNQDPSVTPASSSPAGNTPPATEAASKPKP